MKNAITVLFVCGVALSAVALELVEDPLAVLQSDAPFKDKAQACRALQREGGPDAVPVLAAMLTDPEISHMARLALETMPYDEAGAALRDALGKVEGKLKVGVINSLANRGDMAAAPVFVELLAGDDVLVMQTAARALGRLAPDEAPDALVQAVMRRDVDDAALAPVFDALLDCAERVAERGKPGLALEVYERVREDERAPGYAHAAALRGLALVQGGEKGVPALLEGLRAEDTALFDAALRAAREYGGGDDVSAALAGALPELDASRRIRLMETLAERGGHAAASTMLEQAKEGPVEVRVAAIEALTRIGYSDALGLVQDLAFSDNEELARAARDALSYFPGEAGDAALHAMLDSDDAGKRLLAVQLIGRGGLPEPVGLLMDVAGSDAEEAVRIAALEGVRNYVGMGQMPGLLDHVLQAKSEAEMQAAESALNALCTRQRKTGGEVVIHEALYGDLPDGTAKDVTERVQRLVEAGAMTVDASNGNFGDAAPGKRKQLRVTYTVDGARTSQTVPEGQTLVISTPMVPAAIVDAFHTAFEKAEGESKLAMLRLLGATASPKAYEIVRALALDKDAPVRDAALRELCSWSTAEALPDLMALAEAPPDDTAKVLAMRGAVRLLKQQDLPAGELLASYAALMENAGTPDEKRLVLSGLAQVPGDAALDMVLARLQDDDVKAEAVQAAVAIIDRLAKSASEDAGFLLEGGAHWMANPAYWRIEDGALIGHSDADVPRTEYAWVDGQVGNFYLAADVKLDPDTGNGGIQFRSKVLNEFGDALGYQGDMGKDVWARIYHQGGRGKLAWDSQADAAVKPGEWNRFEIIAIGPAIWTAVNGQLGVAFLDTDPAGERSGRIAVQFHAGPPKTIHYKLLKLVHNPQLELAGMNSGQLITALKTLEQ